MKKEKIFYITTPLYYVNDVPHIGHAYSTVGGDVLARYKRAMGKEVYFQTGTDEHGQKVEKSAAAKGYPDPKAFADYIVEHFKKTWLALNIRYDRFIRTTDEDHKKAAARFWEKVSAAGFIEKRLYEGWYCIHEESFHLEDALIQPGNLCPECERPVEKTKEENYFFKQTAFAEELTRFLKENPELVQPDSRRKEVLGSYFEAKEGVRDISISRASLKWGIPVPGDADHVIYVWFDALINYITGAGWPDDLERFKNIWPADVHIIGKEILRFHAVLWPSMLKAAGLEPPKKVFGTGWIVNDGKKMSKSLGNVVDPVAWTEKFGADVVRYYILRDVPFGQDGSVSEQGIQDRYDKELANDLGNLLNRSLNMINKYFDGKVPAASEVLGRSEFALKAKAMWPAYSAAIEKLSFHTALEKVFELIRLTNAEVDRCAPWKLAKEEDKQQELADCLYSLAESLRLALLALLPFMPGKASAGLAQLGVDAGALFDERGTALGKTIDVLAQWGGLKEGHAVQKGEPLFPRKSAKV